MISLLLAQKIFTLFIMMAMGAILVRTGIMKPSDGKAISTVALYLIVPCSIFSAFQDQIRDGLILAAIFVFKRILPYRVQLQPRRL